MTRYTFYDAGPNMGSLGGYPPSNRNLNEATSTTEARRWGDGNETEHVASFPPPYERDSRGGGYVTQQDDEGFHVGFMPGTDVDFGMISGAPGTTMKRGTETAARPADSAPIRTSGGAMSSGQRVRDPESAVREYVGARPPVQDGHRLAPSVINPALVRMNARNRAAYGGGRPGTLGSVGDKNPTLALMNARNAGFWAGHSV